MTSSSWPPPPPPPAGGHPPYRDNAQAPPPPPPPAAPTSSTSDRQPANHRGFPIATGTAQAPSSMPPPPPPPHTYPQHGQLPTAPAVPAPVPAVMHSSTSGTMPPPSPAMHPPPPPPVPYQQNMTSTMQPTGLRIPTANQGMPPPPPAPLSQIPPPPPVPSPHGPPSMNGMPPPGTPAPIQQQQHHVPPAYHQQGGMPPPGPPPPPPPHGIAHPPHHARPPPPVHYSLPPPGNSTRATHNHAPPPVPPSHQPYAHQAPQQPRQQQQQQDKPKIDPSQIPRPPLFTRPQNGMPIPIYYPKRVLQDEKVVPPPPADSRFLVEDDGNASPQLMRSTLYCIPENNGLRQKGGVGMGLVCTPLALVGEDFVRRPRVMPDGQTTLNRDPQRIPVIRHKTTASPPRCPRCQAYANSFWTGWDCNFCRARHGHSDLSGPAFQYGTVEYEVDGPYVVRSQPVAPVVVYAIDATLPNVPAVMDTVRRVGHAMAQHWQAQIAKDDATVKLRIGCCIVSEIGIFWMILVNRDPSVSVMSDVTEDPFCPLPIQEWTFDLSTQEGCTDWSRTTECLWETIQPLLKGISPARARSPGGAALAALVDALRETGGRATWISHQRPNLGVGAIRDRELQKIEGYTHSVSENFLFCPLQMHDKLSNKDDVAAAAFYKSLGETCVKNRVCIDIVLMTEVTLPAFLDVATMGELCRATCGKLRWIRGNHAWQEQLQEELCRHVLCFSGTDAIFKVRCSEGLDVKSYMTSTAPGLTVVSGIGSSPELELPMVTPDTCVAVELEHRVGGVPSHCKMVYFQSALLYTTSMGRRRVRVSTLALRKARDVSQIFRSADFSALTAMLTRQAIRHVWETKEEHGRSLHGAREELKKSCIKMLANYRLYTSAKSSPLGQLILPETIQLLPLFCMSMVKSDMLRPSLPKRESGIRVDHPSPNADERAFALYHGSSVMPSVAMLMVHPNAFLISNLRDGSGEWQTPSSDNRVTTELQQASLEPYVQLPRSNHLSISLFEDDGIYIIDNGLTLFVHVGKDVPTEVCAELFDQTGTNPTDLSISKTSDYGQQVVQLIWQMRTYCSVGSGSEAVHRPTFAPVVVVFAERGEVDPFEERILTLMVDDTTSNEDEYVEFLCTLHRRIKEEVGKAS